MTAGIVESIRFTKTTGTCENGGDHSRYTILWSDRNRAYSSHVYWCNHPFCDHTPWRLSTSPACVLTTKWIRADDAEVAVAYFLLIAPIGELPHVEARIGIIDQWQDRTFGNYGEEGELRLFTQRYFAESGPGVYPAQIETIAAGGVNGIVTP